MPNTQFARILTLLALLAPLGACVDASKLQQVDIPVYTATPANQQSAAIKGSGDTSGGFMHATLATYLISVDGQMVHHAQGLLAPISISPGVHSLLVKYAYFGGTNGGFMPLMLDAKPGASYVIKFEDRGMINLLTDNSDVTNNYVFLEDEKTGLAVTDKVTDTVRRNTNLYTEPSGDHLSSLQGEKVDELLGTNSCFVMTIDGQYVRSVEGTPLLSVDHPDYDRAFKMTPGRHAIASGIAFGNIVGAYPFMLDVKPDTSYKIRCTPGTRRSGSSALPVFSFWVEDVATKAIVLPKSDLPYGP